MSRLMKCAGALALSFGVVSCAGDADKNQSASGTAGTAGTSGSSMDVDRSWVQDQLSDGDAEVRLGRLADERGGSADVRAFGAMMVEKHTVAGTELKQVASRHNVAPRAEASDDHDDLFEKLSKLSGKDFDRAYLDAMVEEHEEAVKELEDKAGKSSEHADVAAWATKTLPEVKQHLERAKALRERQDR